MLALFARRCRQRHWLRRFSSLANRESYCFADVESKWAQQCRDIPEAKPDAQPYLALVQFPYPSGSLHMGHVRVYTVSDAIARFRRMQGLDVLQPMGWDAFGLPAENAAIARGVAPSQWTDDNIKAMRKQLEPLGLALDWDREVATHRPDYYRWTQWIFTQMHKAGLAYRADSEVNWDPVDETVLANEQVAADGTSWRSGAIVEKKQLRQWFLRITHFSDQLLDGLDELPGWPKSVVSLQKSWIGRSKGAVVKFSVQSEQDESLNQSLEVFTTRPDTLLGVTFLALSKDHEIAKDYLRRRGSEEIEESGLRLDHIYAVHPVTQQPIPVFIADYVLGDYGSGAVMAVPAHDSRDFAFAKLHDLPIRQVVEPDSNSNRSHDDEPFTGHGILVNSGSELDGMTSEQGAGEIVRQLEAAGAGHMHTQYRLRDWLVSRQRYWGAPIPMIECQSCGEVPVPDQDLPVLLPEVQSLKTGSSPLNDPEWRRVDCPKCGRGDAQRSNETLDTFVDSSWYFLRYLQTGAGQEERAFSSDAADRWMPAPLYVGGVEHAILHLLYSRFVTKFLHSQNLLASNEPFEGLLTQGMVVGPTYKTDSGRYVPSDQVKTCDGDVFTDAETGDSLRRVFEKMSKSKLNGVAPEDMIERFGADTTRLFMLFKAPVFSELEWDENAIAGQSRWVSRLWTLMRDSTTSDYTPLDQAKPVEAKSDAELVSRTHACIRDVTRCLDQNQFNVAISRLMDLSNAVRQVSPQSDARREALRALVLMLAPLAPHVSAEFWAQLNTHDSSSNVHEQPWPSFVVSMIQADTVPLVLQVNGKKLDHLELDASLHSSDEHEAIEAIARSSPKFARNVLDRNRTVRKTIVVTRAKNQVLINFVCS